MHMNTINHSHKIKNKGLFAPLLLDNVNGLSEHTIKHLQHTNQIPPAAPRQGISYLQAKSYLA